MALTAALEAGFGIETDFRDHNGCLVIAHDPPIGSDAVPAKEFFDIYMRLNAFGRVAVNVKADGIQDLLIAAIAAAGVPLERVFAFDMSVPDALHYFSRSVPAYTRVSQYENPPSLLDRAEGVWVDDFLGGFPQVEVAQRLLSTGSRVSIVSPELHRRDHNAVWDAIEAAGLHCNPRFEICTDLPQQAFERFWNE